MKRQRPHYELDYKRRIVQEYLSGAISADELAKRDGLVRGQIYKWRVQLERRDRMRRIETIAETANPNAHVRPRSAMMPSCAMPSRPLRWTFPVLATARSAAICALGRGSWASGVSAGLMRRLSLHAEIKRAFIRTPASAHAHRVYSNLLPGRGLTGIHQAPGEPI